MDIRPCRSLRAQKKQLWRVEAGAQTMQRETKNQEPADTTRPPVVTDLSLGQWVTRVQAALQKIEAAENAIAYLQANQRGELITLGECLAV